MGALVATTAQNVFYLTGYRGFSQHLMPSTQVYAVLSIDDLDHPTLIAPIGDLDTEAQFPTRSSQVLPYGQFFIEGPEAGRSLEGEQDRFRQIVEKPAAGSPGAVLLEVLDLLPRDARIAVDEGGISAGIRDCVRDRLGDAYVDGTALLRTVRMVKTSEEIRRLEAAALAIEASYLATLKNYREGVSEAELARVLDLTTVQQGSRPEFSVIAFGERSALPNAVSSPSRKMRSGDIVRYDIGCRTEMYWSDISRTAAFGDPGKKVRERYAAILAGEDAMLEAIGPGVRACDVFEVAVRATRDSGLPCYQRHHTGHGVGLDTYDLPLLSPGDATALEPGMVLEIETPYYELGFGGLQVEDTVVVTEDGCRRLTRSPRALQVIS